MENRTTTRASTSTEANAISRHVKESEQKNPASARSSGFKILIENVGPVATFCSFVVKGCFIRKMITMIRKSVSNLIFFG